MSRCQSPSAPRQGSCRRAKLPAVVFNADTDVVNEWRAGGVAGATSTVWHHPPRGTFFSFYLLLFVFILLSFEFWVAF